MKAIVQECKSRNHNLLHDCLVKYLESYLLYTGCQVDFSFIFCSEKKIAVMIFYKHINTNTIFVKTSDMVEGFHSINDAVNRFIKLVDFYEIRHEEVFDSLRDYMIDDILNLSKSLPPLFRCKKCNKLYRSNRYSTSGNCPICGNPLRCLPPVFFS